MRMKRRSFIKTSLTAGAALAVPDFLNGLVTVQAEVPDVPWQREMPLWAAWRTQYRAENGGRNRALTTDSHETWALYPCRQTRPRAFQFRPPVESNGLGAAPQEWCDS